MEIQKIFRVSFLLSVLFYLNIALITDIVWILNGANIILTIYFFLLHGCLVLAALVLFQRYNNINPIHLLIRVLYLGFIAYLSSRFLITEIKAYKPVAYGFAMVAFIIIGLNVLFTLGIMIQSVFSPKKLRKSSILHPINVKIVIIVSGILLGLLSWSYIGFSTKIIISDPYSTNSCPMRVSFYGFPFGGFNSNYYLTPEWDQEVKYYQDMQTVFTVPWSRNYFFANQSDALAEKAASFHAWEQKGIPFMLCVGPLHIPENRGDYFTYYLCEEMNYTLDLCVKWIETENFSNFYGIQIDPEGPIYDTDNDGNKLIINASQHAFAAISTQNKFNEIRTIHPDWKFSTISVMTAYYDWFDGDRDNDIMLKSISAEPLIMDFYGWQTYMVQMDRNGPIDFYEMLRMGKEHYGNKYEPWIGWYNGVNNYVDYPETHTNTITQLKICKALEIEEVFIAASYRYFPSYTSNLTNFPLLIELLSDLNRTRNESFESFSIDVTQPHVLYTNTSLWIDKITPFYFVPDGNVLLDVFCEMDFEWLFWVEIGFYFGIVLVVSKKKAK
jgi:hypothetical protein